MNFTKAEVQKYKDLNMGLNMETALKPVLDNKFGDLKLTSKYDKFDYINDNFIIELKTRRIKFKQYPTLIFSEKKLIKAKTIKDKRIFFMFKLEDGLYYWEYDKDRENIDNEYFIAKGGRKDRGKNEIQNCVNVKNDYIKNFNDLIIS